MGTSYRPSPLLTLAGVLANSSDAGFATLARVLAEVVVELLRAAVKLLAMVFPGKRLFAPRQRHY